jgi:hypothetical protein
MNKHSSQLDEMIRRAYDREQWTRFIVLARRRLKRMRKESDDSSKARKIAVFRMLKELPELRQQRRIAERVKQRGAYANE